MVGTHHSPLFENVVKTRRYGRWGPRLRAKRRDFQAFPRASKKRGYTLLPKMRNPLEKGPPLWFLTPEKMRILAEII